MQVLLVSAQEAHLSRLILSQTADAEQQRRFQRLAFGLRPTKKTAEEVMDAAREFLEVSGIQQLEERVLSFLFSHSGVLQMLATVDNTMRMLQQVCLNSNVQNPGWVLCSRSLLSCVQDGLGVVINEGQSYYNSPCGSALAAPCSVCRPLMPPIEIVYARCALQLIWVS